MADPDPEHHLAASRASKPQRCGVHSARAESSYAEPVTTCQAGMNLVMGGQVGPGQFLPCRGVIFLAGKSFPRGQDISEVLGAPPPARSRMQRTWSPGGLPR